PPQTIQQWSPPQAQSPREVPEMPPSHSLTRYTAGQTGYGGIRTSNVPEDLDLRPDRVQALRQVLVAAVDDVHVAQQRRALRRPHREQDDHRRAQGRRAHHLGGAPAGRALDQDPVRVEELETAPEAVEVGQVDGAVVVDP